MRAERQRVMEEQAQQQQMLAATQAIKDVTPAGQALLEQQQAA